MSDFASIVTPILAAFESALSITSAHTSRTEVVFDRIPADRYPFVMCRQAAEQITEEDFQQETREFSFEIAIVTKQPDQDLIWQYCDDAETQLKIDRTLGGLVEWLRIDNRDVPAVGENKLGLGVIILTTKRRA